MDKQQIIDSIKSGKKLIDIHNHAGVDYGGYLSNSYPYCLSIEDLAVRMKYLGIDYATVMPFAGCCYFKREKKSSKLLITEEYSKFPYEVENKNLFNELFEVFPEYSDRFLPFPMFDPSRKAEEQTALWEELNSRYPIFGLKTCSTYIQAFVNDLESAGRPIFKFAAKHDLPIIFHSSYYHKDPWANVYDIIKLAENHPELRICIAHTARFTKPVLDRADKLPNCYVDLSAFDIHCLLARQDSEHIAMGDERFPGNYDDPPSVMKSVAKTYPDTIIWGSDTPANYFIHKFYNQEGELIDVSLKSSYNREMEILKSLPEDIVTRISYTNTVKFLLG